MKLGKNKTKEGVRDDINSHEYATHNLEIRGLNKPHK